MNGTSAAVGVTISAATSSMQVLTLRLSSPAYVKTMPSAGVGGSEATAVSAATKGLHQEIGQTMGDTIEKQRTRRGAARRGSTRGQLRALRPPEFRCSPQASFRSRTASCMRPACSAATPTPPPGRTQRDSARSTSWRRQRRRSRSEKTENCQITVAPALDFTEQHLVANGASDLAEALRARYARSAACTASLPLNAAVEVEASPAEVA